MITPIAVVTIVEGIKLAMALKCSTLMKYQIKWLENGIL